MNIVDIATGRQHKVEISPIEDINFKTLGKGRYFFDWSLERKYEVFKLCLVGSSEILGLISLERIPSEWRIHIRLLTVSEENQGKGKKYDKIAGNLIAHAAKLEVADYAELACVSLRPKSQIAQYYINNYKMNSTGLTLSIETPEILNLINIYDHD